MGVGGAPGKDKAPRDLKSNFVCINMSGMTHSVCVCVKCTTYEGYGVHMNEVSIFSSHSRQESEFTHYPNRQCVSDIMLNFYLSCA